MNNRPIRSYSLGSLQLDIYRNDYQNNAKEYKFTVSERYRAKDGSWKGTGFIDTRDLGKLIILLTSVAGQSVKEKNWEQSETSLQQTTQSQASKTENEDVCPF